MKFMKSIFCIFLLISRMLISAFLIAHGMKRKWTGFAPGTVDGWLGFWGGYIGALIGDLLAGVIAYFIAHRQINLQSEGFEAVGDGSVMWGKSSHFRSPEYWLPYFMQRVYVKEKGAKKGIGINIMFDGSVDGLENSIPFITCGLLESTDEKVMKCNELYLAVWTDSDVETQYDGHICTTTFDSDVKCTTYFLPLELLTNQDKVNNYIIQPLIHLFKNERSQVNTLIDEVAIGIEEIIG